MIAFNVEIFLDDLNVNLNETELNNSMPFEDYCEKFFNTFRKIVEKYAPLRKTTRKEKQLQAKPWLTRGLLKSINHKNNLFKKLQKLQREVT